MSGAPESENEGAVDTVETVPVAMSGVTPLCEIGGTVDVVLTVDTVDVVERPSGNAMRAGGTALSSGAILRSCVGPAALTRVGATRRGALSAAADNICITDAGICEAATDAAAGAPATAGPLREILGGGAPSC
mmetsp:Transcript_602/g.1137  ORF Transcript_602/g.1137 Transcript_602/m.1137 type:complete len:133 (-) Transcript_602:1989-2387(-)